MGPSERRDVGEEFGFDREPGAPSLPDRFSQTHGIPVDDGGGKQAEAGHAVVLALARAVADFALAPDPERVQARMIDAILVTELSRWGRSTQGLLDTLYRLDTPHGRDDGRDARRDRAVRARPAQRAREIRFGGRACENSDANGDSAPNRTGSPRRCSMLSPTGGVTAGSPATSASPRTQSSISSNATASIAWRRTSPPTGADPDHDDIALGIARDGRHRVSPKRLVILSR